MALFRFGSTRKLQAPGPNPALALARGIAEAADSTVDPRCRQGAAAGAPSSDARATSAAPAHEDGASDVAVSELNLGDDDFSSIFGSQPSQFSDTSFEAGSLHNDPWSTRLRLD